MTDFNDAPGSGAEAAARAHRHAVEIDPLRQDQAGEVLVHAVPPPPMFQAELVLQLLTAASSSGLSCGPAFGSCGTVQKRQTCLPLPAS